VEQKHTEPGKDTTGGQGPGGVPGQGQAAKKASERRAEQSEKKSYK